MESIVSEALRRPGRAGLKGEAMKVVTHVTSADGTRIAFDRLGQGPAVVVVSGIFCDRQTTQMLAEQLAQQFTVINYDRRGRGDSGNTQPYAVEREIEDLGALIAEAGGTASVYGHSSGAGLALNAAAKGLPITRLVLHEPPYGPDDEDSKREARKLAENVRAAIAEDRRADAIKLFFTASGMPPEMVEGASSDPKILAVAPTMPHDFEVMGDIERGGTIPEDLVRAISIPTLVIAGGASPDFFRDTTARIADLLPKGEHTVLEGQDHGAPADVVVPVVADFLIASAQGDR
jgi:pimeloyl-ACP methyl ester carboxylesterase